MADYAYAFTHRPPTRSTRGEYQPVPTVDDITLRLCGATHFPKLDAAQGYLIVPLVKESQALTTFNTHKGRHKFLRMPNGLRMSQDIFKRKTDQAYENCRGAAGIADDKQAFGDDSIHDLHLHEAIERTRKAGIKLILINAC